MIILKIAAVLFVAELLIMTGIARVPFGSDFARGLVDAALLTLVSSVVIYRWVIRPYVSARDAAEQATRAVEARWKFALEATGTGVWEMDVATGQVCFSKRCMEILGCEGDEIDTIAAWQARMHPEDLPRALAEMRAYLDGQLPEYRIEHRMQAKDGSWRWILDRGMVVSRSDDGRPQRVIGTHADVTEQRQLQEELRSLATTDSLTELCNRRHFLDRLEQAWSLRQRLPDQPVAVLMIDIDFFKRINDTHGHALGDAVLRHFAAMIRAHLRKADSAGRLGGEEFAVVLFGADAGAAHAFSERLRAKAAATPLVENAVAVPFTVSIGVALLHDDDADGQAALRRADAAMYLAKRGGRDRVHVDAVDRASRDVSHGHGRGFVKLVWRPAYDSGHDAVDRQHRRLFDSANVLLNAMAEDQSLDQVTALIQALLADVAQHFQDEEALLLQTGYDELEAHCQQHLALVTHAKELAARHRAGEVSTSEVFGFIAYDVLARHMLAEDRKFFGLLKLHAETAGSPA